MPPRVSSVRNSPGRPRLVQSAPATARAAAARAAFDRARLRLGIEDETTVRPRATAAATNPSQKILEKLDELLQRDEAMSSRMARLENRVEMFAEYFGVNSQIGAGVAGGTGWLPVGYRAEVGAEVEAEPGAEVEPKVEADPEPEPASDATDATPQPPDAA